MVLTVFVEFLLRDEPFVGQYAIQGFCTVALAQYEPVAPLHPGLIRVYI
jgi:hypothetical protein